MDSISRRRPSVITPPPINSKKQRIVQQLDNAASAIEQFHMEHLTDAPPWASAMLGLVNQMVGMCRELVTMVREQDGERNPNIVFDEERRLHSVVIAQLPESNSQMPTQRAIVFFVTLALFPTVLLKVSLISPFNDQKTSESLYKQLTVFLNFNVWAAVGCWLSGFSPRPSPDYLSLPICLRLLFLPLFWFCDYQYDNLTPRRFVFIHNQWVFTVLITLMALSHGYCSSLAMVYAPKKVNESKSQVVGMMSGFFLVLGIASGILFTFVEPSLVDAAEDFFGIFY